MNRKDRAINLGLKINSLKGNLSVAKSVIKDLESEIENAVIDEGDRAKLLELYNKVVDELKSSVSPSVEIRNKINQLIEDSYKQLREASDFSEVDKLEGQIIHIEEESSNDVLKKEHKASLRTKIEKLRESQKKKAGVFLKKNYEKLRKNIIDECSNGNPYYVSVSIKSLNSKVKITPMFSDDRHSLQALLDTNWQKACREIKELKEEG